MMSWFLDDERDEEADTLDAAAYLKTYDHSEKYDQPPFFSNQKDQISHLLDRIIREYHEPPLIGLHALDVGCGDGAFVDSFKRVGCRVNGIDPSFEMIRRAQLYHPGVLFTPLTLPEWMDLHPGELFSIVSCLRAIYHTENVYSMLGDLAAVVGPGGMLIIEADNPTTILDWWNRMWSKILKVDDSDVYYEERSLNYNYTRRGMIKVLEASGWEVDTFGVNLLTRLLPSCVTTSSSCGPVVRWLSRFLSKFDKFVAPFFPGLSCSFVLMAVKD